MLLGIQPVVLPMPAVQRLIAHLDMDAFYASVELLRYPELRGKAVVIGGGQRHQPVEMIDPATRAVVRRFATLAGYAGRGVITTATYEARAMGLHSAMAMMKAAALAPDAILLPVDFDAYRHHSRRFKEAVRAIAPRIEDRGIDEIYIDLSDLACVPCDADATGEIGMTGAMGGTEHMRALARSSCEADAMQATRATAHVLTLAQSIKDAVRKATGLSCSIGIARNKLLAKIASDLDKPKGFAALDVNEARRILADKPVGFIFGVGPATQDRLASRGFRTIADLQRADETELMRQFPSDGRRLWQLARGIDERRVVPDRGAKTISSETTFESDIRDFATLEKLLWKLSEKVSARLKTGDLSGLTISLKLKTADFRQRIRSQSIAAPTQLASKIFAISREMLLREVDGTAFRLMGTGVSALRAGSQADDTDMLDRRAAHAERAIDDLRRKFGASVVIRGIAYDGPEKAE